jgi:hypothetical protein
VGKLVGFYLDSPLGKSLKQFFGKKWSDLAMCYDLNKEHGHLMGTGMRMVSLGKRKASSPLLDQYEIAWEFTSLGESLIQGTHLSAACIVGCQMETKRQPTVQKRTGTKGRPRNTGKKDVLCRAVSHLVSNFFDDDCLGSAPGSDNESSNVEAAVELDSSFDEDDLEEDIDVMEWITFNDSNHNNSNCYDDDSEVLNDAPDSAPITTEPLIGLHWDTTFKINEPPSIKKQTKPCTVQQHYGYLFKTPIDSFFALIP